MTFLLSSDTVVQSILLSLASSVRIAPTQTRIVPVKITQLKPLSASELTFTLTLQSAAVLTPIHVKIPVRQHMAWTLPEVQASGIKASYFFATSMPTAFLAAPPTEEPNDDAEHPPILALRTLVAH